MARAITIVGGRPLSAAVQLRPPSMLLKTVPGDWLPAFGGVEGSGSITGRNVPAYRVVGATGSIARAETEAVDGRPLLASVQVEPPSMLLNTPAPVTPA